MRRKEGPCCPALSSSWFSSRCRRPPEHHLPLIKREACSRLWFGGFATCSSRTLSRARHHLSGSRLDPQQVRRLQKVLPAKDWGLDMLEQALQAQLSWRALLEEVAMAMTGSVLQKSSGSAERQHILKSFVNLRRWHAQFLQPWRAGVGWGRQQERHARRGNVIFKLQH